MYASKIRRSFHLTFLAIMSVGLIVIGPQTRGQSGGQFVIDHSVVAGGGTTNSSGGTFSLGGTVGQPIAGQKASGGTFTDHAGFWIPDNLSVTAAHVELSGRVMHSSGLGIQGIRVAMMSSDGSVRTALTNTFGYFHFSDVEVDQTYVFTAASRKYTFQQTMLVRGVLATTDDLNFIALD